MRIIHITKGAATGYSKEVSKDIRIDSELVRDNPK
jgi:hypothetical protein